VANPNTGAGDIIAAGPLGPALASARTETLLKTPELDLLRLVVPAGKEIPEHKAPGAITVHCLEGAVDFTAGGRTRRLGAGQLLYLPGGALHALRGVEDASVLVTIFRA
jgi:quercetin dioxygenase-like cupin family protein